MLRLFTKIFGTKSERDLRKLWPYVAQINAAYAQLETVSDDALRHKTAALKAHIQHQLQPLADVQHTAVQHAVAAATNGSAGAQLDENIAKLQKQYHQQLEGVLMDILPQAFAIVKETARRFTVNKQLVVTATAYDRDLATHTDYVTIAGEQAIWSNQWEAAGNPVVWDMLHYDVQLVGGIILHQGKIAEMATGERVNWPKDGKSFMQNTLKTKEPFLFVCLFIEGVLSNLLLAGLIVSIVIFFLFGI